MAAHCAAHLATATSRAAAYFFMPIFILPVHARMPSFRFPNGSESKLFTVVVIQKSLAHPLHAAHVHVCVHVRSRVWACMKLTPSQASGKALAAARAGLTRQHYFVLRFSEPLVSADAKQKSLHLAPLPAGCIALRT